VRFASSFVALELELGAVTVLEDELVSIVVLQSGEAARFPRFIILSG